MSDINEEVITAKDLHDSYWKCRDFEISNLWQRSVFLTAFLLGCFTAYGFIIPPLLKIIKQDTTISFIVLNSIAYGISLIGITFSILWIKMGKGSKAWFEAYEKAIIAISKSQKFSSQLVMEYGGFSYNKLPGYEKIEVNNNLFGNQIAGEYSVSKINVGIGQIFLVVWIIISLIHVTLIAASSFHSCIISITILIALLSYFFIYHFIARVKAFKSGAIQYYKKNG